MKTDTQFPAESGHKRTIIRDVKQGEFIRFIPNGPVWKRAHYDKTTNRYCLTSFNDVNKETFKRGGFTCFVDFTF